MNRTISESLVSIMLVIFAFMATNCPSQKSDTYIRYSTSQRAFPTGTNMKLTSDSFVFDRDNVTLDFSYGLYDLTRDTFEEVKDNRDTYHEYTNKHMQSNYAIYLSNNHLLIFGDLNDLSDIESNVNAQLYRHFTYDEAFEKNYGFTTNNSRMFNHSEKLTIPADFFDSPRGCVYIHLVHFSYDVINEDFSVFEIETLITDYKCNGNTVEFIYP